LKRLLIPGNYKCANEDVFYSSPISVSMFNLMKLNIKNIKSYVCKIIQFCTRQWISISFSIEIYLNIVARLNNVFELKLQVMERGIREHPIKCHPNCRHCQCITCKKSLNLCYFHNGCLVLHHKVKKHEMLTFNSIEKQISINNLVSIEKKNMMFLFLKTFTFFTSLL
jgi:hypothetical protein